MPIEGIKIDNKLESDAGEKEAIDKIKTLDELAIIDFLNNEPIDVVISGTGKDEVIEKKTMKDIMQALQKYTIDGVVLSYTADAPEWIKKIIDTPKNDDLLYIIQTIKLSLGLGVSLAAQENGEDVLHPFDIQTKNDLLLLQGQIGEVTIEDINRLSLSDTKRVSPQGVMKALANLNRINPSLGKKISLLIKKGDILGIQLSLGMVVGDKNSNKNANGIFGKYTLNNLGAGKVVKTNLSLTSQMVRGGETQDIGPNVIRIYNMDDVRKWGWSSETTFEYRPSPDFVEIFYSNGRFVQKIDATEPQSILGRVVEGTKYNIHIIKGSWSYNENGKMVITYDGDVIQDKYVDENDVDAQRKLEIATQRMKQDSQILPMPN